MATETTPIYSAFCFGDPPPTEKQFAFAVSLGIPIADGMTKYDFVAALSKAAPPSSSLKHFARVIGIEIPPDISSGHLESLVVERFRDLRSRPFLEEMYFHGERDGGVMVGFRLEDGRFVPHGTATRYVFDSSLSGRSKLRPTATGTFDRGSLRTFSEFPTTRSPYGRWRPLREEVVTGDKALAASQIFFHGIGSSDYKVDFVTLPSTKAEVALDWHGMRVSPAD